MQAGALAFAVTGSTARGRRSEISDLDYYVIGPRLPHDDLIEDVDVFAIDEVGLWRKLSEGDDFVQWTLRYGCVIFDSGILHAAMRRSPRVSGLHRTGSSSASPSRFRSVGG